MAAEQALTSEQVVDPDAIQDADVSRETTAEPKRAEALKVGWRDKDEYVAKGGNPEAWVPAEQFLEIRERLDKGRVKEIERLKRQLAASDSKTAQYEERLARMEKLIEDQNKTRGESAEEGLWAQRRVAMEKGDADEVHAIDRKLYNLHRDAIKPQQNVPQTVQQDPQVVRILEEFAEDHPEYTRKKMVTLLAVEAKKINDVDKSIVGQDLLNLAHEQVRRAWPDEFTTTTTKRTTTAMAETGGTPARTNGVEKTWADLKPDVRAHYENDVFKAPSYKGMKPAQIEEAKKRIVGNMAPEFFKGR